MPRSGRLHIEGGYYHVMDRGLERRYIFEQKQDKNDFLTRLENRLKRTDIQCLAWATMCSIVDQVITVTQNFEQPPYAC